MSIMRLIFISVLLSVLVFTGVGCAQSAAGDREAGQQKAEEFVKQEATYQFDGIPETLEVTGTTTIANGWRYTIEFDSRHAGYGNRNGQMLAQVITRHTAEIAVQSGTVASAVMDGVWDMMEQRMVEEMEISLAPIHEVEVFFMESFPVQVGVRIKAGLRDGCTTPHDVVVTQDGNTINIEVTVQKPKDKVCPAVYTYYEENVNLGSDFTVGVTYTLNVNDYTTTFVMP